MSKIRTLYYFDKKSTQEMISFLNNSANDNYINNIMFNPFIPLHHLLPLKLKFLPESYVLTRSKACKGLITVAPAKGWKKRIEIQKLFFEENCTEDAIELVQYVTSKYKAMGAFSIVVKVDDYFSELISLFITKCGFSQISNEKLWRITAFNNANFNKKNYRIFRNSDAKKIAEIYNNSLLPHFRTILSKGKNDFKESFFKGLSYYNEYKYVIENDKNIVGCIIIRTLDNENYVIDIIQNNGYDIDINAAISYATYQIKKRKKKFGLFVRTKGYTNTNSTYEETFISNGYNCIQNQLVLTNSSARILKDNVHSGKFTVLSEFCSSNPMPT